MKVEMLVCQLWILTRPEEAFANQWKLWRGPHYATCRADNIRIEGRRMRDYISSELIPSIIGHAQICNNAVL